MIKGEGNYQRTKINTARSSFEMRQSPELEGERMAILGNKLNKREVAGLGSLIEVIVR